MRGQVRMGWSRSAREVAVGRGWPEEDLLKGLWPAVAEFLAAHPLEWQLHAKHENNNGLTVLKRVGRRDEALDLRRAGAPQPPGAVVEEERPGAALATGGAREEPAAETAEAADGVAAIKKKGWSFFS